MTLLLDTHVVLWWLADAAALGATAREAIARSEVLVSAASAWEIAIKRALGKLHAPAELAEALAANGFLALPVTVDHALGAGALPRHHGDPFDRMLVAQARAENLTIVTADPRLSSYEVPLLAAG